MIDFGVRQRALVGVLVLLAVLAGCGAGGPAVGTGPGPTPAQPWPQRPVVDASLDLAPDLSSVTGTESVLFTPDRRICEVVFRNWANRPSTAADGTSSRITRASVNGNPVTPRTEQAGAPAGAPGTLVELPLPACVPAGTPVRAEVGFQVVLGAESTERIGHSPAARTAWLGSALPLLAWVRGQGWVRDPAVRMSGETVTSEDFALEALRVTAATDQTVVGTGTAAGTAAAGPGRTTHLFTAEAIRDVAVAAGNYAITEARAGGTRVHVAVPRTGTKGSARDWAAEVGTQLSRLEDLLGPYPYPDLWLTIVPTQSDGVEFPTALQFGDVGARTRPSLVAHELAHMWFYSLVGNNQARDPWLDEAFATFAQAIAAGQQDQYRIRNFGPGDVAGPIGAPMSYWDSHGGFRALTDAVYDQGAAALLDGRERVGPQRFDAAMRAYIATHAHRVATPADVDAAFGDLPEVVDVLRSHGAFRSS
ncbi:M1 family aminopeptidase [Pseudonocardia sp. KRD291]|uniref:M1 family aminopeptidase n=1 Tax=Pseudonocardia sp. KRD291 TaxID=2792007 RepID=UPI001C4A4C30|nr:M1 family aminopeptidase [Pseudonocardia sp. KRD291]MBW0106381.1 hypothetical protein [Pseudonocardia sp. KRD291]